MVDVIVVGGGLVSASAAYHLARAGVEVVLFDRLDAGRATDAGAGILSPVIHKVGVAESWFQFSTAAFKYYTPLMQMLAADGESETGFAICGQLTVAVDADEEPAFEQKKAFLEHRYRNFGVPSTVTEISPAEARERYPLLGEVRRALYVDDAARMDGRLMAAALFSGAAKHGMTIRNDGVDELVIQDRQVVGVIVGGVAIMAKQVIIAGGAWSADFANQLGVPLGVEPQRGQIIHLRVAGHDTGKFPIVSAFHDHYLVSWAEGRVVAGATRETDSGFEVRTTVKGIQNVLAEAVRVAPGLGDAELVEIRVGLRPYTRDKMPVMGEVPGKSGLFLATGHGPNGLQLGPYSGKLAADWAMGKEIKDDLSAFNVTRFS